MHLTIQKLFKDWVDPDIGVYYLACLLGVMKYDETYDVFRKNKGVFAAKTTFSDMLYPWLEGLVEIGMLETNEDYMYRWNSSFTAYWYEKPTG